MGRGFKLRILHERQEVADEIRSLNEAKKPTPRFHYRRGEKPHFYLRIEEGSVGYSTEPLLKNISFTLSAGERVSLSGPNGSGKTTFFKALLGDSTLIRKGLWEIPPYLNIAYLQQFQSFSTASPLTLLKQQCPDWTHEALQHHLSTFLFTDFRIHTQPADTLSEGEKMRLSLALIAQIAPDLIILDEVSNHLDLTTKQHLIDTLNPFEGALLINSHETAFLEELHIDRQAFIQTNGKSGQIVENPY